MYINIVFIIHYYIIFNIAEDAFQSRISKDCVRITRASVTCDGQSQCSCRASPVAIKGGGSTNVTYCCVVTVRQPAAGQRQRAAGSCGVAVVRCPTLQQLASLRCLPAVAELIMHCPAEPRLHTTLRSGQHSALSASGPRSGGYSNSAAS